MARVITETLSGEHSFRGCGCIEVNGNLTALVGSKKFNLGIRGKVRYLEHQVQRVPPEEPIKGFRRLPYGQGVGVYLSATSSAVLLDESTYEGIPGGLVPNSWQIIKPYPPMQITHTTVGANATGDPQVMADAVSLDGQYVVIYEE